MHDINDLRYLMARLRSPEDGCPWDLKQDYQSIAPHTLEEVYEVVHAIEQEDHENLKEELGDLLFQVVFYAQIASERGDFSWDEIVEGIVTKLVRRHPHVFPEGNLQSRRPQGEPLDEADIQSSWDQIKQAEKGGATQIAERSALDAVLTSFPSLIRSQKLQKTASKVGFDWSHIDQVYPKVLEELEEVKEALGPDLSQRGSQAVLDEIGDLIFACVNLARFAHVDADQALRSSNLKFSERYRIVEQLAKDHERSLEKMSDEELDRLWQKAKAIERKKTIS